MISLSCYLIDPRPSLSLGALPWDDSLIDRCIMGERQSIICTLSDWTTSHYGCTVRHKHRDGSTRACNVEHVNTTTSQTHVQAKNVARTHKNSLTHICTNKHRWVLFWAHQRKSEVQPAEFIYYKYTHYILFNTPHTRAIMRAQTVWEALLCTPSHTWSPTHLFLRPPTEEGG